MPVLRTCHVQHACPPFRFLHPEGLPSDYTITLLFRLLPSTPQEPFALWEVLDQEHNPLVGLILDSESGISSAQCLKAGGV